MILFLLTDPYENPRLSRPTEFTPTKVRWLGDHDISHDSQGRHGSVAPRSPPDNLAIGCWWDEIHLSIVPSRRYLGHAFPFDLVEVLGPTNFPPLLKPHRHPLLPSCTFPFLHPRKHHQEHRNKTFFQTVSRFRSPSKFCLRFSLHCRP